MLIPYMYEGKSEILENKVLNKFRFWYKFLVTNYLRFWLNFKKTHENH